MLVSRSIASWPLLLLLACACGSEPSSGADPSGRKSDAGLPDRDPALAHRLVEQEGALLLDVRTPEEFAEGHIDGAHNIPHDQVPARLDEIRSLVSKGPDTPIVVYCRSGRRSGIAKEALVQAGYTRVTNLGGMGAW